MTNTTGIAKRNKEGGHFVHGKPFSKSDWARIISIYKEMLMSKHAAAAEEDAGDGVRGLDIKVTVRELAEAAKISIKSNQAS